MNAEKLGIMIRARRTALGLTQRQLAQRLHVDARAVSKWECGRGIPDVSLLSVLASALNVEAQSLLDCEAKQNDQDVGNMKRICFFVCPVCGSVSMSTGQCEMTCCGMRLSPLKSAPADDVHTAHVTTVEDEWYVTFDHPMSKEHHVMFLCAVTYDRALLVRLYPEQEAAVRIPVLHGGRLFVGCSRDGLFEVKL